MKHALKITLILLGMFLLTQLLGLAVINSYSPKIVKIVEKGVEKNITIKPELPYGMEPPEMKPQISLLSIIFAIIIATILIFLLTMFRAAFFLRAWFAVVVVLALAITFNAFLRFLAGPTQLLALILALPFAFYKIYKRNILVHNFTELLIYPGIAAVFVPILNVWITLALLLIIAVYDVYAVWKAKFMQKLAKFQIQQLKIFAGFFVPYLTKKEKMLLEKMKKLKKERRAKKKKMRIKIHLAILGGGDIAFPLIFAGVILRASGFLPALFVVLFALLSLFLLFVIAKKGKFYPAMLFLSAGCIAGWLFGLLL